MCRVWLLRLRASGDSLPAGRAPHSSRAETPQNIRAGYARVDDTAGYFIDFLRGQPELGRRCSAHRSLGSSRGVHRSFGVDNNLQCANQSRCRSLERRQSAEELERDEKPLAVLSRFALVAALDWLYPIVFKRYDAFLVSMIRAGSRNRSGRRQGQMRLRDYGRIQNRVRGRFERDTAAGGSGLVRGRP